MSKTPKLRFKEFSGDWEIKKLGDLANIGTGKKDTQDKIEDGKYPFFVRSQIVERINSYSFDGEAILTAGDGVGVGKVFHYINGKFDYHQRVYKLSDFKEGTSGRYIYEYFKKNFIREVTKYTAKTSVDSVRMEMITKMDIPCPSIEEQEKIASFFSLIDDKISLQGEKVEALKDYKRGMMQKIFSRELRFKDDEGRDYPEWEERKIKDIFIVTRGVVIAKTEISESKDDKNKYPVYSSQTTNNGILGYDSSYDFEGDYLTWTTDGANAGKVFRRNGKFRCTNVCGVLVEKQETLGFANKMISEILNKETPKHVSYVGNPKLMNGVMGDIKIKVPILDEQIKISKVLDNIDLKIEKEQEKLDCLNEYKKGLLQQMFV